MTTPARGARATLALSADVIVPGHGSEYVRDVEIIRCHGRYMVRGTYFENQSINERPYHIPLTLTLPVSCILSTWPESEPWPRGATP